jgi:hypothetical protein
MLQWQVVLHDWQAVHGSAEPEPSKCFAHAVMLHCQLFDTERRWKWDTELAFCAGKSSFMLLLTDRLIQGAECHDRYLLSSR